MVKNPPVNAEDMDFIPESGRSPGEGNATHSSILAWEVPGRGAWWATVHRVARDSDRTQQLNNSDCNKSRGVGA